MAAPGVQDVGAVRKALAMGKRAPEAGKATDGKRGRQVTAVPKVNASSDAAEPASQFELMPAGWTPDQDEHGADAAPALPPGIGGAGGAGVLACIQHRTVALSKKINLAHRHVAPAMASMVAHRIRHFRNHVHELDLSHNPLRMAGLHSILQAIHDARHIQILNFSSCRLDLAKHLELLQNSPVVVPEYESMSGDEDGAESDDGEAREHTSELNHETEEDDEQGASQVLDRRHTLLDSAGQEKHFAPLSSSCVFLASSGGQPATAATESEDDEDGDGDDAHTLTDSEQAALNLKDFLQDMTTLEQLNLSNNELGISGAFLLAKAAENPNQGVSQTLRVLDVSNSMLGMKGVGEWLEQVLRSCRALTHLNISSNGIRGPDACRLVSGIGECPSLEEIYAAHNGLGEQESAAALGEMLHSSKNPNLRVLDLEFNRFQGSRLGAWPDEYNENKETFSHVLRILDSLLPVLQRFPEGIGDPALIPGLKPHAKTVNGSMLEPRELDQYHRVYAKLAAVLDKELAVTYEQMRNAKTCSHERLETECAQCGAFTGSIMHLLRGLAPKNNVKLAKLLIGGNMLSDEIIGTILHVASKVTCQTQVELDSVTFQSSRDGRMRGLAFSRRGSIFPNSAVTAGGFPVLSVKARDLVLDCGMDMFELQDAQHLVILHSLETGLRVGKITKKPGGLSLFQLNSMYLPPAQVAFEKEMAQRMLRGSNSQPGVLQVGSLLRSLNGSIADLKSQNEEALQAALVGIERDKATRGPDAKSLARNQIRNVGNQPGSVEWKPVEAHAQTHPTRSKLSVQKHKSKEAGATPATSLEASHRKPRKNKASTRKGEWKVAKERVNLGTSHSRMPKLEQETQEQQKFANIEGLDKHYEGHETLPTFACAERFEIGRGPAGFFMLHPVEADGSYRLTPTFFSGKGSPSIDESLSSLKMRGDLINLASESAANRKLDTFWNTISVIRRGSPSMKDAWVHTTFSCPEHHVIGEPFRFEYFYQGSLDRDPDSFKMDWIGLYKVMDEKAFRLALDTSERVGCSMVMAKFRPPHALNAQVQLRHFIWEPGLYQLHMNLVNSEKVVGSSVVIRVDYAHAQLSCPAQVARSSGEPFELKYILDYAECQHPSTDWIGIFAKNPPSYTAQTALQRLMVPPKNMGVIQVEAQNLEIDNEICYFQDFGSCERILGKTRVRCVQRSSINEEAQSDPKRPAQLVKYQKKEQAPQQRHIRFYISGTFVDMQVYIYVCICITSRLAE